MTQRVGLRFFLRYRARHLFRTVYWMFTASTIHSYLLLVNNFATYWPRPGAAWPSRERALVAAVMRRSGDASWDEEAGVLRRGGASRYLEAVVAEAAQGGIVNVVAGVLLVLTQASPSSITVGRRGARADLRYPLGGPWVAAYTVWNFTFVYGRDSHGGVGLFAAFAVVHLGAPLLAMRGDSAQWIEARAYTLAPMMVLRMVAPDPPFLVLTPGWYAPPVAAALRFGSLALGVWVAARALSRARRTGAAESALGVVVRALVAGR